MTEQISGCLGPRGRERQGEGLARGQRKCGGLGVMGMFIILIMVICCYVIFIKLYTLNICNSLSLITQSEYIY